jgi:hypothetical protein
MANNADNNVVVHEEPQMKVMGHAAGSITTAGGHDPNTNFSSRAEPSMEVMGNAAGFDYPQDESQTVERVMHDMTNMIRRYPLPSLLAGIGLGYLMFSRRSLR